MKLLLPLALLCALASSSRAQGGCGITPYGEGLGGTNTGSLWSSSTPALGGFVAFEMQGFDAGPVFGPGLGLLLLSGNHGNLPLLGGTLLIDPSQVLSQTALQYDVYAEAFVSIPEDPALAGVTVYAQAGLQFPASGSFGLSNGLSITLCP